MRQELEEKIMMCLMSRGIDVPELSQELTIILSDYEITARETAVAIRCEDKNKYFMQKFLIAKMVKGCTDRTLELYKTELWRILNTIGKPADEITTDDVRLYLALRQKRDKVKKVTANNELRYLSTFFRYLLDEELIAKDPVCRIDKIKYEKVKKKAFTELEVEKIRDACRNTWESAVVEILLSTGCRISELANIKIADLEDDSLVVHGKGNKDRTVYLNAKAVIAITKYLKDRKDENPYLFPGGFRTAPQKDYKNWYKYPDRIHPENHCTKYSLAAKTKTIGKRAGVQDVHAHRFRRTCATFALRRGMPIEQVSKMLGHEDIGTTQIYLDLTEEDLRQAHKKYVI